MKRFDRPSESRMSWVNAPDHSGRQDRAHMTSWASLPPLLAGSGVAHGDGVRNRGHPRTV